MMSNRDSLVEDPHIIFLGFLYFLKIFLSMERGQRGLWAMGSVLFVIGMALKGICLHLVPCYRP